MAARLRVSMDVELALAVALAWAGLLFTVGVAGERPTGVVAGRVLTATDMPIQQARVVITSYDKKTGQVFTARTRTDDLGRFRLANVPAGVHSISSHCPGFNAAALENLHVREGSNPPIYLRMSVRQPEVSIGFTRREFVAGAEPRIQLFGAAKPPASVVMRLYPADLAAQIRSGKPLTDLDGTTPDSGTPLAEWQVAVRQTDEDGNFYRTISVPTTRAGGYLVSATLARVHRRFWILVTPLGLAVKAAPEKSLVYTASLPAGRAAPGVRVEAWANGRRLWEGTTGDDGTATWPRGLPQENATFLVHRSDGIAFANAAQPHPNQFHCYLYTDRPVYRPSQRVYIRGVLRRIRTGGYEAAAGIPVSVEVKNPEDKTLKAFGTATSSFGTFSGQVELPNEPVLGGYTIEAKAGGETHTAFFEVQEYRKPEYQVSVSFPRPYFVGGEPLRATITARYYFGAPVAGAGVTYSIRRQPYLLWEPQDPDEALYREDIGPGAADMGWYGGYGEFITSGEATTNENGEVSISISTRGLDQPQQYVVEANVTDISNRTVTGMGYVPVSPSLFRLSVMPVSWLYTPSQSVDVRVRAADLQGKVVPNARVHVQADLVKWSHDKATYRFVRAADGTTNARGAATVTLGLLPAGLYRLTATAQDSKGTLVKAEGSLWVSGEEGLWGAETGAADLELVRNKSVYHPGETARVLITTKAKGVSALVTVEGRQLFGHQVVSLSGGGRVIEVPLTERHMPNVHLSVCVASGSSFVQQDVSLNVSAASQLLQVRIAADRSRYKPGQRATYRLDVRDRQGRPVRAELSLGVVDEAVYAVRRDQTPDIRRFFYGPFESAVMTSTNMSEYYAAGADKMGADVNVRRYFPDTAFWSPSVLTDERGAAVVSFIMPDSLTTWRATARAVTVSTEVGSAIGTVLCTKDLIIRPALPRFFMERDRVVIGASVHNYTSSPQRVRVSISAPALVADMRPTVLYVGANSVQRVEWEVAPKAAGTAVVRMYAAAVAPPSDGTDPPSDAVEVQVPVLPHGLEYVDSHAGEVASSDTFALTLPPDALATPRELTVSLSPSVASAALGVLEGLRRYRYESAEGIMDVLLPDVVMSRALREMGLNRPEEAGRLRTLVEHDLRIVYRLQHEDGSWGWWEFDPPDGWMTAYVLYGLIRAREAGFDVQRDVYNNAVHATELAAQNEVNPDKLATMVYVLALAGQTPRPQLERLLRGVNSLQNYSISLLILALEASGNHQRALSLVPRLVRGAVQTGTTCSWPETFPWGFYSCNEYETTGYAIRALLKADPPNPCIPKAVRWLMLRRRGDRWSANYDTAAIIYALADYLTVAERERPSYTASVEVNGQTVRTLSFGPDDVLKPEVDIKVPASLLRTGANRVTVSKNGAGPLYYTAMLRWFSGQEDIPQRSGPVSIRRTYHRLVLHKKLNGTLEYAPRPLGPRVAPGDLLQVQLDVVAPRDAQYLVVQDHIPSGCELVGALEAERGSVAASRDEWGYWWSGQQFGDATATFYLRYVSKGTQTITYTVRPELAGEFHVLPARLTGLYEPDLAANSAEMRLAVTRR